MPTLFLSWGVRPLLVFYLGAPGSQASELRWESADHWLPRFSGLVLNYTTGFPGFQSADGILWDFQPP